MILLNRIVLQELDYVCLYGEFTERSTLLLGA
jgi:hypothetical protein